MTHHLQFKRIQSPPRPVLRPNAAKGRTVLPDGKVFDV
jgi:hypothetical protein